MATFPTDLEDIRGRVEATGWQVRSINEPSIRVEGKPGPPVVVAAVADGEVLGRVTVAAVVEAPRWLAITYGGLHSVTRTFDNATVWVSALDSAVARHLVEHLDGARDEYLSLDGAAAALETEGWATTTRDEGYDSPGWELRAERPGEHLLVYSNYRGALGSFEGTRLERGEASRCRDGWILAVTARSVTIAQRLLDALV